MAARKRPTQRSGGKPAGKPGGKPAGKPGGKPARKPGGKPRATKIERAMRQARASAEGTTPTGRKPRAPTRRQRGLTVTPLPGGAAAGERATVRLNRFLAMAGVCSRRAADEFIAAGRVEVNGERTRELGLQIDPAADRVEVDGQPVQQEKSVYVLLNKPKGVVCTNARNEQKTRVIDLLPTVRGRLFTVGRLDLDSEGLLLVTNDGDFAQRLTHPRHGVPKIYAVVVRGKVEQQHLQKARGGVWLAEGPTSGMRIRIERGGGRDKTFLKVTLREGKNREIRRVFAKLGLPVLELKRIRIGELSLHGLRTGEWRFLQAGEVEGLLAAAQDDAREFE